MRFSMLILVGLVVLAAVLASAARRVTPEAQEPEYLLLANRGPRQAARLLRLMT